MNKKQKLKGWLVFGWPRFLTGPIYTALIGILLTALRIAQGMRPRPVNAAGADLASVTAVIKTFERPHMLRRLVKSIRRIYPELHIIVVDDSQAPTKLEDVQRTITLPYDSGVSAGRQAGLDAVATPYVLMLDDDFVFTRRTRLDLPLQTLAEQPDIDLLAGDQVELPGFNIHPRTGAIWPTPAQPLRPLGSRISGLEVVDKTPNVYLARTGRLREVGWDPNIKRLDHAEFFTRALGKLVCVQDHRWQVLHAKTPFDRAYMAMRMDVAADYEYIRRKWGG